MKIKPTKVIFSRDDYEELEKYIERLEFENNYYNESLKIINKELNKNFEVSYKYGDKFDLKINDAGFGIKCVITVHKNQ